MTIQRKRLLELSPSSESHRHKKGTQNLFPPPKHSLLSKEHFLTTNANSPIAPPKTKLFTLPSFWYLCFSKPPLPPHPYQLFNHQTHQPTVCIWFRFTPLQCQRVEEASHLLSPSPGVTSSFAFRLVRSAFFAPLLGLQRGAAAAAGAAGRRWRRWRPAEAMGGGGAVKGTGRDGKDGHLAWLSFLVGRKYDKPTLIPWGFAGYVGRFAESNVTEIHKKLKGGNFEIQSG